MIIKGIHHIALKARGEAAFQKTMAFYRDLLGMPVVRTWGTGDGSGAMVDTGAGLLEISANGPDEPGEGALRHMAFEVDDTDAWIETVRRAGYAITVEPKDIVIASQPPYPARIGFCIGPVGEEVEFFQLR